MIKASNCYKYNSDPDTCEVMQDIRKYNEYDCKVLWEIIYFFDCFSYAFFSLSQVKHISYFFA
jgi:hypothetical protein